MKKYGIPTAEYQVFTDAAAAMDYVKSCALPVVVKADGLALGKGVLIAETREDAVAAVESIMLDRAFGDSGNPCWLLPTARPWSPWYPPWTTSGPMTMTRV